MVQQGADGRSRSLNWCTRSDEESHQHGVCGQPGHWCVTHAIHLLAGWELFRRQCRGGEAAADLGFRIVKVGPMLDGSLGGNEVVGLRGPSWWQAVC